MTTQPKWTPQIGDPVLVIPKDNPDGEFIARIVGLHDEFYTVEDQDGARGDYAAEELELYG